MNSMKYCRFCAEQKSIDKIMDFKYDLPTKEEIIRKLTYFNIVYVNFSDKTLPETVCTTCYNSITSAYDFFNKIKSSQILLTNHFSSIKTEDILYNGDSNECYEDSNSYMSLDNVVPVTRNDSKISLQDFNACIDNKIDPPISNLEFFVTVSIDKEEDSTKYDVTWSTYSWTCKFCYKTFPNMVTLRDHSKEHHDTCNAFKCNDCDADCENFNDFIDHVREHRDSLQHFCPYCNVKLEDESDHKSIHMLQPSCHICGEIFSDENQQRTHFKQYHRLKRVKRKTSKKFIEDEVTYEKESWQDYHWICQFCNLMLPDQVVLRSHTKEAHKKCFGIQCVDCHMNFNSFGVFVDHVREHRPSLKYFCQYCNYKFVDPQESIIHLTNHLDSQMQCDTCTETFSTRTDLQKHINTYNPPKTKRIPFKRREKPITVEDLTCDICHKVAKSLNNLRSHKLVHTDRHRDYTCDRCGKAFFTKGSLSTHNIIHENPEPQVCKICKKTFLTLTRLKKHVKTHYTEKPFQCLECHRCFRLKEQLKGHMITHTDLLPYPCQYCDKAFRHRNVLKIHENQHTGARPYSCDVCNMGFANWSNCNKHMKRKHGMTLAKSTLTPQGKLPINPKTGKPKKVKDLETVKEWTEQIMAPLKKGKKSDTSLT